MKKIISLLVAIFMVISVVPAISADTLSQGKFTFTGEMEEGKGTIHVDVVLPAETIEICGLEMEVIIPEKLSFSGEITTPLSSWEIRQSATPYKVGGRYAKKLFIYSTGSAIPTSGTTATVLNIPISYPQTMAPGDQNVTVNLSEVAMNGKNGEAQSALTYFEKSDEKYTYSSSFKYYKYISGATVTGLTDQTYTGSRRTPAPTVKLDGATLKANTDYTVSYSNNIKCGVATATIKGKGNYIGQIAKQFYIIPKAVTSMSFETSTVSQTEIKWSAVSGADGYYVYRSLEKDSGYSLLKTITDSATLSYTDSGLLSGTKYYYKIQAYSNIDGKKVAGVLTASCSYKTTPGYTINTTTGLKLSKRTSTSITLKWSKTLTANDGKVVTGYYIYRSASSGSGYKKIATITEGDTVTYKDTGLSVGKTYYYRVEPYRTYKGEPGVGAYASLSAATLGKVATVGGFKKSTVKVDSIKLVWNSVSTADGYEIYHSKSKSSGYSLLKTTTSKSYTHSGLLSGITNYYKIRAYRLEDGKKVYGGYTSPIAVKTAGYKVAKPTKLKMASNTASSIKISWKKVSGANGYYIYRSTSKDSGYKKIKTITKGSTVSFANKKLSAGKVYYYRVVAYRTYKGEKGIGSYAQLTAGTKTKVPKITLKKASKTSIKVTTEKVSGASGYQVYYSTKKSSGYKKAYTGSKTTYTKKSLKKGKRYYVKVRTYKTINGKKYYSSYSGVKSIQL